MKSGLLLAACLLLTGLDVPAQDITDAGVDANHGEACIALAVFSTARNASWFEQALVAKSILNTTSDTFDACAVAETLPGMSRWRFPRDPEAIDPIAWRTAQDVARAVASGDYYIPEPCDRVVGVIGADRFIPDGTVPVCVVGASTFVAPVDLLPQESVASIGMGRPQ